MAEKEYDNNPGGFLRELVNFPVDAIVKGKDTLVNPPQRDTPKSSSKSDESEC
jgi:hypothetical protein